MSEPRQGSETVLSCDKVMHCTKGRIISLQRTGGALLSHLGRLHISLGSIAVLHLQEFSSLERWRSTNGAIYVTIAVASCNE